MESDMAKYGFVCLLVGSLSWGQAVNAGPALTGQQLAHGATAAAADTPNPSRESSASGALQDKPLITIKGLCEHPRAAAANSTCTTLITRAEFETIVKALQPGMPKHAQSEFAEIYANALVMASKAEEMGLDKDPSYEEQMQLARIQVLSQALKRAILEKASQISEADIEQYYQGNIERFEKMEVERIYLPKNGGSLSAVDQDITVSGGQKEPEAAQEIMKKEADDLRARAVAGDDFSELQTDAYKRAGIKSAAPATSMWIRRISLPPSQSSVTDMKPGDVSPVMADSNGYFIYKVKSKDTISLEQARDEIIEALRSQHIQNEMRIVLSTATTIVDENYFTQQPSAASVQAQR